MNQFYYITVATKPHTVLDKIKETVAANNESIHILGLQENRDIGWNAKGNFGVKLREVKQFVDNPNLQDDDIILFTDAYDVIYCSKQDEIVARFKEMNHPIIFGAETDCNPDPRQAIHYSKRDEEFSYLNSGLFIGYVWAIRNCTNHYVYDDQHDDQLFWTMQYLKHPSLIQLDYHNKLFLNTYNMNWDEFSFNGQKGTYRNRNPLFIHVNGPNKTELSLFI